MGKEATDNERGPSPIPGTHNLSGSTIKWPCTICNKCAIYDSACCVRCYGDATWTHLKCLGSTIKNYKHDYLCPHCITDKMFVVTAGVSKEESRPNKTPLKRTQSPYDRKLSTPSKKGCIQIDKKLEAQFASEDSAPLAQSSSSTPEKMTPAEYLKNFASCHYKPTLHGTFNKKNEPKRQLHGSLQRIIKKCVCEILDFIDELIKKNDERAKINVKFIDENKGKKVEKVLEILLTISTDAQHPILHYLQDRIRQTLDEENARGNCNILPLNYWETHYAMMMTEAKSKLTTMCEK